MIVKNGLIKNFGNPSWTRVSFRSDKELYKFSHGKEERNGDRHSKNFTK